MRPLNIKITGFGTYCTETNIDFTKLGSEGLYLITGDTGSGKTTIFDAITFALYGEPSGSNRDASMLRSSYASLDDPTEVQLTFELREKVYKISRNPTYERSKRGGGTTFENANAELTLPDGIVVSGVKEVNHKIEEILGIKKSQFCQIAMIAQGDFQKLLFDSSENRQGFFRTLFKTENYQKLQEQLKAKVSELKGLCNSTSEILNHEFSAVQCDNEELIPVLEEAKSTEMDWEEKIALINKIIDCDNIANKNLQGLREENQKKLDNVKLSLGEMEKAKKDSEEAENIKVLIEKKEHLIGELEETVTIKKMALDECGEKEKAKTLIGNDLPKYDELDNQVKALNTLGQNINGLEQAVNNAETIIGKKSEEIKLMESRLLELKDADVNYEKYLSQKNKLEEKNEEINGLEKRFIELNNLKNNLVKAQNDYKEAGERSVNAGEKYAAMNKAYLDGQAGILASGLEDNKPCPVCGSLNHPAPCKIVAEVPGEEELKAAKAEAEKLGKIAEELSKKAAEIGAGVKAAEKEINSGLEKLFGSGVTAEGGCEKITKEKEIISNELTEININISQESGKIKEKKNIEDSLPGYKENLEKIKADSINNNNKLIQSKTQWQALEKQIGELKNQLKFESKSQAQSEYARLEQQIDYIKKSYETAFNQFNDEKNKINELRGNFDAVSKRVKEINMDSWDEVNQQFAELTVEQENINKKGEEIITRLRMNQQALENITKHSAVFLKNENKLKVVDSLSATANGTLGGGHEKIQLETYVQMAYFDKILHHANTRLLIMSDGQYELVRKKEGANLRSKTGLDLNVIDHYTGCQRSVKSLSGGECFQASLSLALGLSDEVTSSAGGIKIDTMFVDEGFGTLDPETIQKAYKALISVTEGNKLVGIISHVDYLKDKIDKQIVVTKTRDVGSSVTIRT